MFIFGKKPKPEELVGAILGLLTEGEMELMNQASPDSDLEQFLLKVASFSKSRYSLEKSLEIAAKTIVKMRLGISKFRARNLICDLFVFELFRN